MTEISRRSVSGPTRRGGRKPRCAHLFDVKAPSENRSRYDCCKMLRMTAGNEAFRPIAEGNRSQVHG